MEGPKRQGPGSDTFTVDFPSFDAIDCLIYRAMAEEKDLISIQRTFLLNIQVTGLENKYLMLSTLIQLMYLQDLINDRCAPTWRIIPQ